MEFLKLIETLNIYSIQILFLINFYLIFAFSYPLGRMILNKNSKDLLFCSIFSTSCLSIVVATIVNFSAVFAKYIFIMFILLNIFLLFKRKKFFTDLKDEVKKNLILILSIPLFYILILNNFYPIELKENFINIPYSKHSIYFFSPIQEIINADYLSRIKNSTLFPMEWPNFYFFQSSFNAFYLNFFSSFGYLGLLFFKNFFFSIFILDLFLFLFKK